MPTVDYDGLIDAIFNMIRQNASGSPAVLIRLIEVLTAGASAERTPGRLRAMHRHADLVLADAEHSLSSVSDLADLRRRHEAFVAMCETGRAFRLSDDRGSP
jgi:uncharacterized membrane protein